MVSNMGASRIVVVCVLIASFVSLGIFVAAFASRDWISKDFSYNSVGTQVGTDKGDQKNIVTIQVSANLGLFTTCYEESLHDNAQTTPKDDCDDGMENWQDAAFSIAICALVFAVLTIIFTALMVCEGVGKHGLWFVTTLLHFMTMMATVMPVLLFAFNKGHVTLGPSGRSVTLALDAGWGFYLALVSPSIFALCIVMLILVRFMPYEEKTPEREPSIAYNH